MIEGLKPYGKYKNSGQLWLGMVPEHWLLMPNRAIFDEVKDRNHPKEEMLSVTITRGIVRQKALLAGSSKKDSSNLNKDAYKLVQPQDIAYNKMRAWQGALGASSMRGIISPAYVVMRPRSQAISLFYHHLYRTPLFSKEAERWSYGITSDMWSLRPEHFKVIGSILPPMGEQAAIVRFLDHANQKIDGFIRAKRKLISLLNEQKQAIIHHAVTRGLNLDVALKPSGIPWLGDIPKHWVLQQLRRVCRKIKTGGTPKGVDESYFKVGGFNWHTPSDFRDAIELGDASRQLSKLGVNQVNVFPAETILMIGIGATIGKVSISRKSCSCNQQINAIIPNATLVHLDFLAFYLRTLRTFIFDCGNFTTMPIINQDETKRLPVAIPPMSEQIEIANYIKHASKPITEAIARTEREIILMQEYRTRLTTDIVTGKLDVREAAAKLPDEVLLEITEEPIDFGDEVDFTDEEIDA